MLIMDNDGTSTSGGRYVELGYAIAMNKRIVIVGKENQRGFNMFGKGFDSWDDLYKTMGKKKARKSGLFREQEYYD